MAKAPQSAKTPNLHTTSHIFITISIHKQADKQFEKN